MVTRDRPDFALQSVRHFLAQQDYDNRELVIVEDGKSALAQRLPDDPRIRLVSTGRTRPIGVMRNHSVELARGTLLMLWDDDDWHGGRRIAAQVAPLLEGRADLTALTDLTWLEIASWRAWRLEPSLARRLLLHQTYAGTVAFHRRVWEGGARFGTGSVAEDAAFVRAAISRGARLEKLRGGDLYVYVRHAANSWDVACGRTLLPRGWRRVPVPDLPADDVAFLRAHTSFTSFTQNDQPLVSCLMPTYDRRDFVDRAIDYFLRQTWPRRELIVVDDGTDPVGDLVEARVDGIARRSGETVNIRYHRLPQRIPLGTKRNIAVELAAGDVLAHWDDDDWYPADRLAAQLSALMGADALLCGTARIPFYDPQHHRAMEYRRPPRGRPWLAGTSLMYRRRLWQTNRFADVATGEDTRFVWRTPAHAITSTEEPHVVALVHRGNTVAKSGRGSFWSAVPIDQIEAALGEDMAFYRNLGQPGLVAR
jgi:glycosyltransferase involved in cell wall biosynthesis